MLFGSDVYPLALFPTDAWFLFDKTFEGGILVSKIDVWGGVIAAVLVAGLALFFQRTKTGRALARRRRRSRRGAVGRHSARLDLVRGLAGGRPRRARRRDRVGHQARRAVLDHVPGAEGAAVLIIGGFTSVPGAIVGGLIVGAGEKLAEAYLGPFIGGGIEYWFAYVLALIVLMARPQGCSANASSSGFEGTCFYRETGQFKTSYSADMAIFRSGRIASRSGAC
jgi:branched-chain amino acid transport system permease protein